MGSNRWMYIAILGVTLTAGPGCDGGAGDGQGGSLGGPGAKSYQVLEEGTGEPLAEPMWTYTVGSRLSDYVVRGYRFHGEDVAQLTKGDEMSTWRGWLQSGEDGLLEVGDVRHGMYPKPRTLMPPEPRIGQSWFTSPWGLADDRVVKMGKNPLGDSQDHNGETVTLAGWTSHAPWGDGRQGYTIFGWREVVERQTDLHGHEAMLWVPGIGPVAPALLPHSSADAVILDASQPRPEAGPRLKLKPAMDDSLVADSFRPGAIDLLALPGGGYQVLLAGDGALTQIVVGEAGGGVVTMASPSSVCLRLEGSDFHELEDPQTCPHPNTHFVRADGSLLELPEEQFIQYDGMGNIIDAWWEHHGAYVEEDGALIHFSGRRGNEGERGFPEEAESRSLGFEDGTSVPVERWKYQRSDDGAVVFQTGRSVATWDGDRTLSRPLLGPLYERWSVRADASGYEFYDVTADGRLREVLLRPEGVSFRPIGQLDLPKKHAARAAVRVEGDRYLVFTHTGDVGHDSQWYHEKEVGYEHMEWKIENYWVDPDFGDAHLWFVDGPGEALELQHPPISETVTVTPVNRNLEVCWSPLYGPPETEGWDLAGFPAHDVLVDAARNCLLLVRHPVRVAPVRMLGANWAHGPLPTVGRARIGTVAEGHDDGWIATAVPKGYGDPLRMVTSSAIYWPDPADPWGPAFPTAGVNPRLEQGWGGVFYSANQSLMIVDPEHGAGEVPFYTGPTLRLSEEGAGTHQFDVVDADGWQLINHFGPHELADGIGSAGVQGRGALMQDVVYFIPEEGVSGGSASMHRTLEPPMLPTPDSPWRHEAYLKDQTLCGHLGDDTLYCIRDGVQQELSGVENLSSGQWWITDLDVGVPPKEGCTGDCAPGMIWLLGVDAADPVVRMLDARDMGLEEYPLVDFLPDFPEAPEQVRVETLHRIPDFASRPQVGQRPCSLIGATTPDGPWYWVACFGSETPEHLHGPMRLELPKDMPWAAQVAEKPLPHLRPIQEVTQAWVSLDDFRYISLELGDVTDSMVDASTPPHR